MSARSLSDTAPASPELLRQFANMADQHAFEIIVQRHGAWMTATAQRMTEDAALTEEIVQDAFTLLAGKLPKFPTEAAMGAWLHRTVVHLARNQLAKLRRRERKHLIFASQDPVSSRESREIPDKALKLLDALIETLPEADRQLIVGRYFNELTWKTLATTHGISPETVRKRTERILQRLAARLPGHAVNFSALSPGMIPIELPQGAAGFPQASTVAAASAASCANLQSLTLLNHALAMMNAPKLIFLTTAVCTLVFSVPIAFLTHDRIRVEDRNAVALESQDARVKSRQNASQSIVESPPTVDALSPSTNPADTSRIPGASKTLGTISGALAALAAGAAGPEDQINQALVAAVGAAMEDPNRDRRVAALQFLLQWLRPVDVATVRDTLKAKQKPGVLYVNEGNTLLERWAQLNGREAMEDYVQGNTTKAYNRLHSALVQGWAATDPDGLMVWLNSLPPECDWKDKASGDILRGLVQKDPARATELLLKSDSRSIAGGLPFIADRVLQEEGPGGLANWLYALPANQSTDQARSQVAFQLAESQAFADPQAAIDCIKFFDNEPWGGAELAARIGTRFGGASPERAFDMLDLLPFESPLAASLSAALFSSLSASQPNATAAWLNANPNSPYADRAAETLARAVKTKDPAGAEAWARKIRQEGRRNNLLKELGNNR